jgi:hypothetical protein
MATAGSKLAWLIAIVEMIICNNLQCQPYHLDSHYILARFADDHGIRREYVLEMAQYLQVTEASFGLGHSRAKLQHFINLRRYRANSK